ncbi:MAG: hypothetical protein E7324_05820, partial [Clostridiales bacterium]|nr:hypothetical protein [Clostridiales bacterium]
WLYGGDPMLYLTSSPVFAALRAHIGTDYYEKLLNEALLDDEHTVTIHLLPSKTKGEEDRAAENARLEGALSSWTDADKQEIYALNQRLIAWQATPDSPEAMATLPQLSLSQVAKDPEKIPTREYEVDGVKVLLHELPEKGVTHLNLYFPLTDFAPDALPGLSFLTNLLGELPTRKHSVTQLKRSIRMHIGTLSYGLSTAANRNNTQECLPFLTVSASFLTEKTSQSIALIAEILNDTLFTGPESAALIGEILRQDEEEMRQALMGAGHSFAISRASAHFSAAAYAGEMTDGFSYYQWLKDFARSCDDRMPAFQAEMAAAADTIFDAGRVMLGITAEKRSEEAEGILSMLKKHSLSLPAYLSLPVDGRPAKEAILIPAGVSYAVSAGHLACQGRAYDGAMQTLSTILSFSYLWNEIRVQGGAYGCGFRGRMSGLTTFHSYRDPSPLRSEQIYDQTGRFLENFCASEEPLEKFIISSIAATEPLRSPKQMGLGADADYLNGLAWEDRQKLRHEMLSLTKEKLLSCVPVFDQMAKDNARCIVGNSDAMKDCGEEWTILTL